MKEEDQINKDKFKSKYPIKRGRHSPSPVSSYYVSLLFNRRYESHNYVKSLGFFFFNIGKSFLVAVRKVGFEARMSMCKSQVYLLLTSISDTFFRISMPWFSYKIKKIIFTSQDYCQV